MFNGVFIMKKCTKCDSIEIYEHGQCKPCRRKSHKISNIKIRSNRKMFLIDILGGKCIKCGSIDNLEFDHIYPNTKSFTITHKLTRKIDILIDEIKKCQLLCYSCHKKKTAIDISKIFRGRKFNNNEYIVGVRHIKHRKTFESSIKDIRISNKRIYLYYGESLHSATEARKEAELLLWGWHRIGGRTILKLNTS
jgi:5-methylcytosine-specific restriction endonuclease McrA